MAEQPDTDYDDATAGASEPSEARESIPTSPKDAEAGARRGVIEAVADLLQFVVDWLRQEAEAAVRDKVVRPLQRLGLTLASGCAAAMLLVLGIGYISVAVFMLLAEWLTYPGALLLVGGVLVLGAVIFTAMKMRSMQK